MILDTTLKLEAVLAGAVTANQPEVHFDYIDYTQDGKPTAPQTFRVALNSTNDVTILASPTGISQRREPTYGTVYNKDTAAITVTIKTDDGTTERIIAKKTIEVGGTWQYTKLNGWFREAVV